MSFFLLLLLGEHLYQPSCFLGLEFYLNVLCTIDTVYAVDNNLNGLLV